MTCNSYWDEITRELFSGQIPQDHLELVARVYRAKLQDLHVDLLIKNKHFVSKWFYDTSTGAATGVAPLWFFCWRGSDRTRCWLSVNTVDTKIYVVRAAGA
jgi:hypothetical protein